LAGPQEKPGTLVSLGRAARSWRTLSVALLSFSSGLPLGLVWIAIPDWMRGAGADLPTVGLFTLAQAPWTFKFVWSPLMDRFVPPFWGRRRGWTALAQVALAATTIALAGVGHRPEAFWVVLALALAIAFAAATQDIAIDAYAVDVLRPDEQGIAVGARIATYRAAMFLAGGAAITLAGRWSWPAVCVGLGVAYLPLLLVTWRAPEPEAKAVAPATLRESVWLPFLGFLSRHRALEILAFVVLYKLTDNLGGALLRPFLRDMGYGDFDRGFALATIGLWATLAGTFLGGAVTSVLGLGHSLWLFGAIQILSNVGYVLVSMSPPDRVLMYSSMGFESFSQGLGTGAFSVLLLRMTQKRFSATQYALFSSLFALPRLLAGPISGVVVDSVGWTPFFWATIAAGVPGLALLARFVPLGVREPEFTVEPPHRREPLSTAALVALGAAGAAVGLAFAASFVAAMDGLKGLRATPPVPFDLARDLAAIARPDGVDGWVTLLGLLVFAATTGVFVAATAAARSGAGAGLERG
jgi:PAT family beta-lactamase induction signal transducer AmpG